MKGKKKSLRKKKCVHINNVETETSKRSLTEPAKKPGRSKNVSRYSDTGGDVYSGIIPGGVNSVDN